MSTIINRHQLHADYQFIERFFDFDLTEEERLLFEQRMKNEPDFFRKIQNFHLVHERVEAQFAPKELAAQQQLKTNWKKMLHQAMRSRTLFVQRLQIASVAAAFLVLAVLAWWWLSPPIPLQPKVLAMEYYQKTGHQEVSNIPYSTRGENTFDKTWENVSTAFENQEYQMALDSMALFSSSDSLYHQILLLRGKCYFELGNFDAAVTQFQAVINYPNGGRKDLAWWYQALAYLQRGEVEKAKANLERIVAERYPIAKEAKLLLLEMGD